MVILKVNTFQIGQGRDRIQRPGRRTFRFVTRPLFKNFDFFGGEGDFERGLKRIKLKFCR